MNKKEAERLIEVWDLLDVLAVSLDRLGSFEVFHGHDAAQDALNEFMGPPMAQRIAHARTIIMSLLETHDPTIGDRLEAKVELEWQKRYWNGPASLHSND